MVPTCSTPITLASTRRGTPSSERTPLSRRIGLRTSAWSTSESTIARRSAAMRPAKPRPSGMRSPRSSSSSRPFAARATSSPPDSSSRMAAVSAERTSRTRSRTRSISSSGWARLPSATSVTDCSRRTCSATRSAPARARRSDSSSWRCSSTIAIRSPASWRSSASESVNSRGLRVPTWSTPSTRPSIRSGTPSRERMPFSRRIGLSTRSAVTSGRWTGRRSAAIRPANPLPTGIRTPRSTSSSSPFAARMTTSLASSSRRSTAAVSAPSIDRTRSSSSSRRSPCERCARAVSVTAWRARSRSIARSSPTVAIWRKPRGVSDGAVRPLAVRAVLERPVEDAVDEAVGAVVGPGEQQDLHVDRGDHVAELHRRLAVEAGAAHHVREVDEALDLLRPRGAVEPVPVRPQLGLVEGLRVHAPALQPAQVGGRSGGEDVAAQRLQLEFARGGPVHVAGLLELLLDELPRLLVDQPPAEAALVRARHPESHPDRIVPASEGGQLLSQRQNRREEVALLLHPREHLVPLEGEQLRVLRTERAVDLVPFERRGNGGPLLRAQRVHADRGRVLVVRAPVHQHAAAADLLGHPRDDLLRVLLLEQLGDRFGERLGLVVARLDVQRHVHLEPLRARRLGEALEPKPVE